MCQPSDLVTLRGLTASLGDRRQALESVCSLERRVIEQIANNARQIRSVSFVRPSVAHERRERAIIYSIVSDNAVLPVGDGPYTFEVSDAGEGQSAPWPFTSAIPFNYAIRKIWCAPPGESRDLAVLYLQDHEGLSKVMMDLEDYVVGALFGGAQIAMNIMAWWVDHTLTLGVKSLSFFVKFFVVVL